MFRKRKAIKTEWPAMLENRAFKYNLNTAKLTNLPPEKQQSGAEKPTDIQRDLSGIYLWARALFVYTRYNLHTRNG